MANRIRMPQTVFIGKGSLEEAERELCALGKKALIVTGKSMIRQGHVEGLVALLGRNGLESAVFSDIPGEPTDMMIEQGYDVYCHERCDFIIGFGGGSPMDAAKAIGIRAVCPGKLRDFIGKTITEKLPPIAAIPSTAGTGSEATPFTIITDTETNVKMLLKGNGLLPVLAIVDPAYSMNMPQNVTVSTGLDALTHAIEAYTSKKAFCETDLYALSAVKRIFAALPVLLENGSDESAREQMSIAAYEAGISFGNASVTIVHGMSRPIGALFHVPHGISNAMLLKTCLSYVADGAYDRFAALGRSIGAANLSDGDEMASARFLDALSALCARCGVPALAEYGIDRAEFMAAAPKMAADAMASGSPSNTRKAVSAEDILAIYRSLWP